MNRIPRKQCKAAREAAKEKCGLHGAGGRLIANLSKGFQQRVGLAQAIIHLPPVVILDEPTIGLDPIQIREIRSLIRELGKDHSVILSTHILPEVQATCDRVQIINKGSLVLSDSIAGLSQHMRSTTLSVAFRKPPDFALLEKIGGVKTAQPNGANRVQITYDPKQDPTDQIIALASEKRWGLYEITPHGASLEQIFLEITTEEPTPARGVEA